MKIQVSTALDLKNPMSRMIMAVLIGNSVLKLVQTTNIQQTARELTIYTISMLFALYVLSCYRNGGCNVLAMFVATLILVTELLVFLTSVMELPKTMR